MAAGVIVILEPCAIGWVFIDCDPGLFISPADELAGIPTPNRLLFSDLFLLLAIYS